MKYFYLITLGISLIVFSNASVIRENIKEEPKADTTTTTRAPLYGPYPPNTNICFPVVGCFSNAYPFNNTGNYLPVHPDQINTEFILFTRKNQNKEDLLSYENINTIIQSNFDKALPLKIIIHGFANTRNTSWLSTMKNAILKADNVNVLIVAWGDGAIFPLYNNASSNIRLVGKQLGLLINKIREQYFASFPAGLNVHCIGHSLGAHTCGYGSNAANIRFNRITGMDTAGPFFEDTDPAVRLDPSDADFVDAIHTNGGNLLSGSFGIVMPVGHLDFYVNGGQFQPGCPSVTSIIGSILSGGAADPTTDIGCSHGRVYELFIESMSSICPFLGFACNNEDAFNRGECTSCTGNKCNTMGYRLTNTIARGKMYLKTSTNSPYCGYLHSFDLKINPNSPKTAGELLVSVEESTNKTPQPLTKSSDDILPNASIIRLFVVENDMTSINIIGFQFNKKPKPFLGSDPNALSFSFDKVKITNLSKDKSFSKCISNTQIADKEKLIIQLNQNDCI